MKVGRAMAACVSGGLRSNSFHIFLLLAVVVSDCCGHLVLTYPPARKYPLDSLTNVTTQAPCGMPKGRCSITVILISFQDGLTSACSLYPLTTWVLALNHKLFKQCEQIKIKYFHLFGVFFIR